MQKRRLLKAEHGWWFAIFLWLALASYWQPDPPKSFTQAATFNTQPKGFSIFHDFLNREVKKVGRTLGSVSRLSSNVDVLLLLTSQDGIPQNEQDEMLNWVSKGGTLILGYPLKDEMNQTISSIDSNQEHSTIIWSSLDDQGTYTLNYQRRNSEVSREVGAFSHKLKGELHNTPENTDEVILIGNEDTIAAATENIGLGTLIHISSADLLANRAMGTKQSHLFAAALIDEVGRDKTWIFSHKFEGIPKEPSLLRLVTSGKWRPLFLQFLLMGLFLFWWRSAILSAPKQEPPLRKWREVTTLARDVGNFYHRSHKSTWALERSFEFFKLKQKEKGASIEMRKQAAQLTQAVENELRHNNPNMDRHIYLIRKMADFRQKLTQIGKRKKA